jgi:3-methyl-2-oxobutanoate hydroxymethyltransferase
MAEKITVKDIVGKKQRGEKMVALTLTDYPMAVWAENSGIDLVMCGDSLGMVELGFDFTFPTTLEMMIHHGKAVARGTRTACYVVGMPFGTYTASPEEAVRNASRLMQETGCDAVKIQGGVHRQEVIRRIVDAGIPVMGHVGLTPHMVKAQGGFRLQGKTFEDADSIIEDAVAIEQAGGFAMEVESIPWEVAKILTKQVQIPTFGIGAGPFCDGQILVTHDLLGMFDRFLPKFSKKYCDFTQLAIQAMRQFAVEAKGGQFPTLEHSFKAQPEVIAKLQDKYPS